MNKRIQSYIYIVGGISLVLGAALYITGWAVAPVLYIVGSLLFGAMQVMDRYRGDGFVLRRLSRQQLLGAAMLVVAGVVMVTCEHNEWILCLLVGCILELYTAFRIPQEMKK